MTGVDAAKMPMQNTTASMAAMFAMPLFKKRSILGIGRRITRFNQRDSQVIQGAGNFLFIFQGEADAFRLRAIPQCCIQDFDHAPSPLHHSTRL